jgi:acetolactate synthase-1/2/3 large subunit
MKVRGADVLARALAAAGTRNIFTLSGNHVMPVFDAALEARLSLLHVRHEAAAVHMADAWGRLTGEAGIALVTGGPGHANAVSALYTALMADSPVVLISGHAPLSELGKGSFQEMRQADIAAPLCKASWTAQSAQTLGTDVARAIRTARSGIPGPVHLSVPNDVLDAVGDFSFPDEFSIEKSPVPSLRIEGRRPLIIAGPGVMRDRDAIRRFEEETGIPVIGMESPRGVNDPSLGRLASVLGQADAVLLAGKRKDFTLKFGRIFAQGCEVLETEALPVPWKRERDAWFDEVKNALSYRPEAWQTLSSKTIHPVALCREVQKHLDDAVLVADGGEFGQWAQACLQASERVVNGPAGSIGAALPLAAAAKLARPDLKVVAMLGDGTFGFHMSEIDTAVRYGLNYVAVIGNDACWNAEYQIQLRAYGKERAHGLDLLPTRYGAVAAAMGAHGEDVTVSSELESALERAVQSGKPAVVNVSIERVAAPSY